MASSPNLRRFFVPILASGSITGGDFQARDLGLLLVSLQDGVSGFLPLYFSVAEMRAVHPTATYVSFGNGGLKGSAMPSRIYFSRADFPKQAHRFFTAYATMESMLESRAWIEAAGQADFFHLDSPWPPSPDPDVNFSVPNQSESALDSLKYLGLDWHN